MKQEEIIERVEEFIQDERLFIKSNKMQSAFPRFWLYDYLKTNTVLTLREISHLFGRDDHSSIVYGIRQNDRLRADSAYQLYTQSARDTFSLIELDIEREVELTLRQEVLRCETFSQMRRLQTKIRKV